MLGRHFRGDLRLSEGEGSQGVETYTGDCFPLWGFLEDYLIKPKFNSITTTLHLLLIHLVSLQAFCMKVEPKENQEGSALNSVKTNNAENQDEDRVQQC